MNDDLETIRCNLTRLAASAKLFLLRLPIIKQRNEWREQKRPSLGNPGARRFIDELDRAISAYYEQFDGFAQDAHRTIQALNGIVPQHEFTELVRDTTPSASYQVARTCNAVLRTKDIVEEIHRRRQLPFSPTVPTVHSQQQAAALSPSAQPETSSAELSIVALFNHVLEKKNIGLETWLRDHHFKRSSFMAWKAAGGKPVKGKVSVAKAREFEAAIRRHATEIGLM
jgi:hypothetical protein